MFSWSRKARLRLLGACLGAIAAAALAGCGASATSPSASRAGAADNYYLALGDSLSVGIQPNARGQQLETDRGYVNDIYAGLAKRIPRLKLIEMGCPGDATPQVITGQGNTQAARTYHCDRAHGSQLDAALAFLRAHRSQVKLISIDIGANDLNACITATAVSHGMATVAACVERMEHTLATNLPRILKPLKSAAAPGTPLVTGEIYDPFLVGLLSPEKTLQTIAQESVGVVNTVNAEISSAATQSGFRTAEVSAVFETDDAARVRVADADAKLPRSLVVLCAYTYLCTAKPRGPNIHPNAAGYRAIAKAYEQQIGGL
jgi:lysophospholipase L1-like esterase